jgi:ABC-2 type transport system permease protein
MIDVYREGFAGVFTLEAVTQDEASARAALRADQADVVLIVPDDVYGQLLRGQQPQLHVLYTETDPTSNAWVKYFTVAQTNALNRRLLVEALRRSQGPVGEALDQLAQARAELDAVDAEVGRGDYQAAATRAARLGIAAEVLPAASLGLLDVFEEQSASARLQGERASTSLAVVRRELQELAIELDDGAPNLAAVQRRLTDVRTRLATFEVLARQISRIPPTTLVSPLTVETENTVPVEPTPIGFYMPAVLALLLQHMGVTLSSLSAVRDRRLGAIELFRVSPVGAGSIVVGKSLGYGLLLGLVGLALTWAAVQFLSVPAVGPPLFYGLALGLTIFASVGLGFALSLLASTESQVVQLSMLVLLASVFLGGFFLPLDLLFPWVRSVAYVLPATHGAIELRAVMLRGVLPAVPFIVGPLLLGLVFYTVAILGLRGHLRRA